MQDPTAPVPDPLNALLAARGLAHPDSRPLYRWQVTDDEFGKLTSSARQVIVGVPRASAVSSLRSAAVFCLWAAEWWGREYDGSWWRFDPLFEALGVAAPDPTVRTQLIEQGLRWWRRPLVNRGKRYIGSLAVEAGIPVKVMARDRGRLVAGIKRFVRRITEVERLAPGQARRFAEQEADDLIRDLPDSLRREEYVTALIDLAEWVVCQRAKLASAGDVKPIDHLDRTDPLWRDQLPLRQAPETDRIVADLLRAQDAVAGRAGGGLVKLDRGLERQVAAWREVARLSLPDRLRADMVPGLAAVDADLRRLHLHAGDAETARHFGAGRLASFEKKQDKDWVPLGAVAEASWRPVAWSQTLCFTLVAQGVELAAALPGAQSLDAAVVVLRGPTEASADGVGDVSSLICLPEGMTQSPDPVLAVAWTPDHATAPDHVSMVPECLPDNRRLAVLDCEAAFALADRTVTVRPKAGRPKALYLVPIPVPGLAPTSGGVPVSRGLPACFAIVDGEEAQRITERHLRWRRPNDRRWQTLPAAPGPVVLGQTGETGAGAIIAEARIDVLPEGFGISANPESATRGTLALTGLAGARLSCPAAGVSIEGLRLRWQGSDQADTADLPLTLRWPDGARLTLLVRPPGNRRGFVGPDGRWVPRDTRLNLGQLYGFRARAPEPARESLWLEVRDGEAGGKNPWRLSWTFRGELSLFQLEDDIRRLLDAQGSQDRHVRLSLSEDARVAVHWYAGEIDGPAAIAGTTEFALGLGRSAPAEPVTLPAPLAPGAWIRFARRPDGALLRPRPHIEPASPSEYETVVDPTPDGTEVAAIEALDALLCEPDRRSREKALKDFLKRCSEEAPQDGIWPHIAHQVRLLRSAGLPLRTAHLVEVAWSRPAWRILTLLAARPDGMAALTAQPVLGTPRWEWLRLSDWVDALRRRWLARPAAFRGLPESLQAELCFPAIGADLSTRPLGVVLAAAAECGHVPLPALAAAQATLAPDRVAGLGQFVHCLRQEMIKAADAPGLAAELTDLPDWREVITEHAWSWPPPLGDPLGCRIVDTPIAVALHTCLEFLVARQLQPVEIEACKAVRRRNPDTFDLIFCCTLGMLRDHWPVPAAPDGEA